MGLFQRSSHRSQQQQQYPSDTRHQQVSRFNDEQENRKPSSASVATNGSKRRGLLGGLIRGRNERQSQPPPTHPNPHQRPQVSNHPQVPLAPSPLQNVPVASATNQELRQKLQEAQKVEAFLSQAGTFKPTIGGSDIEFLFNHIATPTAAPTNLKLQQPHSASAVGKRNHEGQLRGRETERRLPARQQTVGNPASPYTAGDPQSPFHRPQQHRQQPPSIPQPQRPTQLPTNNVIGERSYQSRNVSVEGQLYDDTHAPQHVRSSPQIQSWVDPAISNHDTYSVGSSKRSKGSSKKHKKNGRRGFFSTRSDLDAFESEEAYYNAMRALDEGRQFQNVSNAFSEHFNKADNTGECAQSQSSNKPKRSRTPKGNAQQNASIGSMTSPPQATKLHDDAVSHKSRGSSHRSAASSSKQESDVSLNVNTAPLRGILRTNGKFGGGASAKLGKPARGDSTTAATKKPAVDGNDKKEDDGAGGGFDVYTSNSGDEMFIGIRPSSSSESSGLYTDEHELIELRACLNSTSNEEQHGGGAPSQPHDRSDGDRREHTSTQSRHDRPDKHQQGGSSQAQEYPDESRPKNDHKLNATSNPERVIEKQPRGKTCEKRHDEKFSKDKVLEEKEKSLDGTNQVDLQESTSENSDVFKAVQDRFTDMITSVGTFHEKQAQKIEEMKRSFISTLSPAPEPSNVKNTPSESGADEQDRPSSPRGALLSPPLTCNTVAQESFDERGNVIVETNQQDELYRELMNTDGQNVETAAYKLIKGRSTASEPPIERSHNTKTVEYFQSKRVFQRAETQKLMSRPQFKAEAAPQSLHSRTNVDMPGNARKGYLVDGDDDPSLAEVMDINPSSSSDEARENLRQYWESQSGGEKQVRKAQGSASAVVPNGHMGLILPGSQLQQEIEQTTVRVGEKCEDGVDHPPTIGKGSSLGDNRQMDGVVFSIESEDDSLLKDDAVPATTQPVARSASRMLYDGPIPSAKSSFSMARSRQLSLVDTALSEDDTLSTVTTELMINGGDTHIDGEQKQINTLIDRLEHIEKRSDFVGEQQDPSVDQTIADEISEIKSLLQGLKAQTNRRINQQDPPPDNSKSKKDAPDDRRRTTPDKYGRDAPDDLLHNHSSGSSTASSGYVKKQLRQPDPVEGSNTITPRSVKTADFPISAPRDSALRSTPTFASDGFDARNKRGCRTAPHPSHQQHEARRQEPRQLFGNDRGENQNAVDWPDDSGTKVSVKDRVKQFHSQFSRNTGSAASQVSYSHQQTTAQFGRNTGESHGSIVGRHEPTQPQLGPSTGDHGNQFGSQASYGPNIGSQHGVEQTQSQFGRKNVGEHGSYIGSNASYGHYVGSQLGVEQTRSQFGQNAEMHESQIGGISGNHASCGQQVETRNQAYSPHPVQSQYLHHQVATELPHRPTNQPLHHNSSVAQHESVDEFFYSRTESDLTTSIVLEQESHAKEVGGTRQHKSSRAASYFDTLSAGVKAGGSFDSVSDRYSASTISKKTRESTVGSQTKTLRSDTSTLDSITASRSSSSKDDDTKSTLPSTDTGFRTRIFRNAKSHIKKMSKNGDISDPFKARVLRVMDPLVGKSSSDDEEDDSTIRREKEGDHRHLSPSKGYLPACHFFCG